MSTIHTGIVRGIEAMASTIVVTVLLLFAFTTVYPHFAAIPQENQQMLAQQNSTLQNILLVIVAFFFSQSSGNMKKDNAIAELVSQATAPSTRTQQTTETVTIEKGNPSADPTPGR